MPPVKGRSFSHSVLIIFHKINIPDVDLFSHNWKLHCQKEVSFSFRQSYGYKAQVNKILGFASPSVCKTKKTNFKVCETIISAKKQLYFKF